MSKINRMCMFFVAAGLAAFALAVYAATVPVGQLTGALHWRSVGPYTGGRVTAVAGVPGEPNLYYAGYAGSGVWETDDYGHSWKNLTDKYFKPNTSGAVGAMAVAPSNPKIIYVGTGDSAPRNTVLPGHGMYKSTDAGKTWKYIGLGETHIITWILVDPKNPEVVYVAALGHLFGPNAERGVFKSSDGGQSWKKILYVNDETGAVTLAMDPENPEVIYASMWQMSRSPWTFSSGGPDSGIYKSTDGGAHWTDLTRHAGLPHGVLGRIGVAVAASQPDIVYAMVQAKGGGLFRSDDAGATWHRVNGNWSLRQRGFYYMSVYVDPTNPRTLYVPNVDGVWVSHNGGKAFALLHMRHGDNHIVWINPQDPKVLLVGNDGGATVSTDGGRSWSTEHNQPTGQFYHVALDQQFPFDVYGAH